MCRGCASGAAAATLLSNLSTHYTDRSRKESGLTARAGDREAAFRLDTGTRQLNRPSVSAQERCDGTRSYRPNPYLD
jgi:hypothetical protein